MPGFFDPLPGGDIIDFDRLKLWLRSQTISLQKIVANALNVATQGGGSVVADFDSGDGQSFINLAADRINIDAGTFVLIGGGNELYTTNGAAIVYTANGTFDKDDFLGLRAIDVEVQAGGGGGGAATDGTGAGEAGGGGGGGYARSFVLASALAASETVTVGAGGAGGTTPSNNGSAGGVSSFGGHAAANGGSGGAGSVGTSGDANTQGGTGGAGTAGDVQQSGDTGFYGIIRSGVQGFMNFGAGSRMAGSTRTAHAFSAVGNPGQEPGGGGSGARTNTTTDRAGGAGGKGRVVVRLFF